jgi:leucyl-tRNA synthetase
LFDTWYDAELGKGRPISELPIPPEIAASGEFEIRKYQDEHRLAYQDDALVNWCPGLGTVLANEEVIDGLSDRGQHPVERRPLRQWMLRITAYADRLQNDLELVNWPEGIKKLQRDWIGRSTGAEVDFYVGDAQRFASWKTERAASGFPRKTTDNELRIYTTRVDTLFGATYMVVAPEHPFVERLTTDDQREAVQAYCQQAAFKSDRERQEEKKQKTGVFTGSYAINPINDQQVPIWIADYVLISYGTGAIMAVPAHDDRDFEFATQFKIPIIAVVDPPADADVDHAAVRAGEQVFTGKGIAINSGGYNGLATEEFKQKIAADLEQSGAGQQAVNYKLRDWLFSRQRFWGEPFPILKELDANGQPNGLMRAVDPQDLPVDLPHLEDYKPHGRPEPPLEKAGDDWLYPVIDGKRYKRETNTMPQWAGSCWYYLRFIDPGNDTAFIDADKERAWMPVDLYVGGAEHAVLHLLYSRFWHKVLFDRGHVSCPEPFQRLINQGMILGEPQYRMTEEDFDANKQVLQDRQIKAEKLETDDGKVSYVLLNDSPAGKTDLRDDQVEKRKGQTWIVGTDIPVTARADKMSKSRGNVVNPDHVVQEYGADALRLYEMFMGPLEATKPWNMSGVNGVRNFLDRAWRMIVDANDETISLNASVKDVAPSDEQLRVLHKTIKAITFDTEQLSYNTAIARMMEFVNFFTRETVRPISLLRDFVLLLAPYAPHLAEELWSALGGTTTLAYEPWPVHDEALTRDSVVEIPVQILGKVRGKITVDANLDQAGIELAAREDARIAELLDGKKIIKVIVVPGRMVNFVVK